MQWLIDIVKEWLQLYLQGMIIIWSGAIVDIPDGWHLCDGTNGTPDLRNRFIAGAGNTYVPDQTGGITTHSHPFTGDGHAHTTGAPPHLVSQSGAVHSWPSEQPSTSNSAVGTTDTEYHLPPYYALAYIMKL